jgi:Domain of unknown function (DUF4145)
MDQAVVIDCHRCALRVSAQVRGTVHLDETDVVVLAECPSCHVPLVGLSELYPTQDGNRGYEHAERAWPAPSSVELSSSIPESARRDIKDAQKCLSHSIFSAAVVLCGKALERLTREKIGASRTLADGLRELKSQGIIDERLFDWADALRKERNLGAHAGEEEVSKENAEDVLAFTIAIFEYVYTLSEKYQEFLARKAAKTAGAGDGGG